MKVSFDLLTECFILSKSSPSGIVWNFRPRSHFADLRSCNMWNTRYAGCRAGARLKCNRSKCDYWQVRIEGTQILCHRIVYILTHGVDLPDDVLVDHEDQDGTNNHPDNLRIADTYQNSANTGARSNSKTGIKGASFHKQSGKFISQFRHKGKSKCLGKFDTVEAAGLAYQKESERVHGKYSNSNSVN